MTDKIYASGKVYVVMFKDGASTGVKRILESFGVPVLDACDVAQHGIPSEHEESLLIAVTVHDGNNDQFPNKNLRVSVSIEQARDRGFAIPDPIMRSLSHQLVPVVTIKRAASGSEGLERSLESFHNREYREDGTGKWLVPKGKAPSRQCRTELWRAGKSARARERQQEHALQ